MAAYEQFSAFYKDLVE
jgi:uncharacterized coiled-coil protein SlyX